MVYQPKQAKDGEKAPEVSKDTKQAEPKKVLTDAKPAEGGKKASTKEPEVKAAEPAEVSAAAPKTAEPAEPTATKAQKKKDRSAAKKAEPAEKPEKKTPGAKASHDVGSLKQMVLAKDAEILKLEIHLERKDTKIDAQAAEIRALKKQLADNAKGDALKE